METKLDNYSLLMGVWTITKCLLYIYLLNIARKKGKDAVLCYFCFLDEPLSRQLVSSCSLESMPFLRS